MLLHCIADTTILQRRWWVGIWGSMIVLLLSSAEVAVGLPWSILLRSTFPRIPANGRLYDQSILRGIAAQFAPERTESACHPLRKPSKPLLIRREPKSFLNNARRKKIPKLFSSYGTLVEEEDLTALAQLGATLNRLFTAFPPHKCDVAARSGHVSKTLLGSVETQWLYRLAKRFHYTKSPIKHVLFPEGRSITVISAAKRGQIRVFYSDNSGLWSVQYETGERFFPEVFSICLGSRKLRDWATTVEASLINRFRIEQTLGIPGPHDAETEYHLVTAKDIILFPQRKPYVFHSPSCFHLNGFIMHQPDLIGLKQIAKITKALQYYLPLASTYGRLGLTLQILIAIQSIRRRNFVLPRLTVDNFYVSPRGLVLLKFSSPLIEEERSSREGGVDGAMNTMDTAQVLQRTWDLTERLTDVSAGRRSAHMTGIQPVRKQVAVIISDLSTKQWDVKNIDMHPQFVNIAAALGGGRSTGHR